jgi:hypothetical protein
MGLFSTFLLGQAVPQNAEPVKTIRPPSGGLIFIANL